MALVVLVIATLWLLYIRARFLVWACVVTIYLIFETFYSHCGLVSLIISWAVWLGLLSIVMIPALRIPLFTIRAFKFAKNQLPTITETERAALKSGTVSWDGELFSGKPDLKKLFAYQPAKLSQEEQEFISGSVEELCKNEHSNWDMWHKNLNYPKDLVKFVKDNGFLGMIIPKEYGGKGFSVLATWQTVMKVSDHIGPLSTWIVIANSIGAGELIDHYGTDKQKKYYLPRLARGAEVPCFALTSPIAGSDATSIEDHGVICYQTFQSKKTLGVRLNFSKRYITLGNEATLISLAFKLYDPDHLLGENEELGITLGLVPADFEGVIQGRRHYPVGAAFHNGPLRGNDVFIPLEDNIIGGRAGVGQAWKMLTQVLATGRATSLPTGAIASSKMSFYTTVVYCGIRKQFGLPVGAFQSVQEKLAEMAGFTYLTDALRLFTFAQIQAGERPAIPAAISKYISTELSRQCAIHGIDLQGGKGVMNGPSNYVANLYASAPVAVTVEGSNTMTRGLIIFGQGAVRCHPYILAEMNALDKDDSKEFDELVMRHIGFAMSNHVRAFFLGLTNGRVSNITISNSDMCHSLQQLMKLSAAFALLSDVSMMVLGGKLKRMEALSGRFADVLSMLFIVSASIKHFHDKGYPAELLPVVQWSNQWALYQADQKLVEIIDNFPNFLLKYWLRFIIFPLGIHAKKPTDKLTLQVGALVQESKSLRETIAEGMFMTPHACNPISLLEEALAETRRISPINKRIRQAVKEGVVSGYTYLEEVADASRKKIITKDEEKGLYAAHEIIMKIINVDDFIAAELQKQK